MKFQPRPQEAILFEGDGTLLKSKLNVKETEVLVTNERLVIAVSGQTIEKADVASVAEGKHGFAAKLMFTLRDGSTIDLMAANFGSFKAAAFILVGQPEAGAIPAMPVAPDLSVVKNGTAWVAALGPLFTVIIMAILVVLFWGNPDNWGWLTMIQILLLRIALLWMFLRIDYLSLQKQGYAVKQLGLADPAVLPYYLFSRAKVFGHSKAYGITWCVLVTLDLLLAFA
ncbi:hypothetical protein SAMN05518800_1873 [Variovorax sp. YR752]|uniref:hypothetical protein n=1 Tax=Variovorax sp. YR752 TaxID=1884383 RepID=UPI000BCDAADF|nr:hypothetical protein [Variovorax sp. YR752]SOD25367.1 hypothetical protein SAMN05518800_1873 [Variovorax sp. YR752]